MISEYWLIRRGHYRVKDLYSLDRKGWYWYTYGINFRWVHYLPMTGNLQDANTSVPQSICCIHSWHSDQRRWIRWS